MYRAPRRAGIEADCSRAGGPPSLRPAEVRRARCAPALAPGQQRAAARLPGARLRRRRGRPARSPDHLLLSGESATRDRSLLPLRDEAALLVSTRLLEVLLLAPVNTAGAPVRLAGAADIGSVACSPARSWAATSWSSGTPSRSRASQATAGSTTCSRSTPRCPQAEARAPARRHSAPPRRLARAAWARAGARHAQRWAGSVSIVIGMAESPTTCTPLGREPSPRSCRSTRFAPSLRVSQNAHRNQLHMQARIASTWLAVRPARADRTALSGRRPPRSLYAGSCANACVYVLGLGVPQRAVARLDGWLDQVGSPGHASSCGAVRWWPTGPRAMPRPRASCRRDAPSLLLEDAGRLPYPGTTAATGAHRVLPPPTTWSGQAAHGTARPDGAAFPGRRHTSRLRARNTCASRATTPGRSRLPSGLSAPDAGCRRPLAMGTVVEFHVTLLSRLGPRR